MRGRLEIIYEILSVCREPVIKTKIMYGCNLSHKQLRKYLEYLISLNLLSPFEKDRKGFFQVTEKGREFLKDYRCLKDLTTTKPQR